MSRQSKNARNLAKARDITRMHLAGEKGPSRGAATKKQNAWWQKGDYTAFIKGGKKGRGASSDA